MLAALFSREGAGLTPGLVSTLAPRTTLTFNAGEQRFTQARVLPVRG